MFISGRNKGLQEVDAVLGERCLRAYSCKHIECNLKDKFGGKAGLPVLGKQQELAFQAALNTT